MIGHIYCIRNRLNNKIYIGQTIGRLSRRWANHCNPNNGTNSAITKAIIKYGKRAFEIFAIESLEDEVKEILIDKLNVLEKAYIERYSSTIPNGYNILIGGKNSSKPEHVKKKISKSLKGNPKLKTNLGKTFSESWRINMSNASKWSKAVECVETGKIYNSITQATEELGLSRSSVSRSLRLLGLYQGNLTIRYARK